MRLRRGSNTQPWEKLLAGAVPLYFRDQSPRVLRKAPSSEAPAIANIPADPNLYGIQPLQFRGDWARVRVSVPSRHCADPRPTRFKVYEGWVRWRGAKLRPGAVVLHPRVLTKNSGQAPISRRTIRVPSTSDTSFEKAASRGRYFMPQSGADDQPLGRNVLQSGADALGDGLRRLDFAVPRSITPSITVFFPAP